MEEERGYAEGFSGEGLDSEDGGWRGARGPWFAGGVVFIGLVPACGILVIIIV